ncbi:unnamed protein product [Durusdinium trenchii]|uniref:Uncharacterized protein n=1 Tax=Durusdinium trenchii TaxID=1381693 RepID=A0ABP0RQ24_9DINO
MARESVIQDGDKMDEMQEAFLGMLESQNDALTHPEKRHRGADRAPRKVASPQDSNTPAKMEKIVQLMSALMIRHEDSLNAAAMQDQYLIFCTRGDRGAIPLLLRQARQWKDMSPQQTTLPLRCWLIQSLLAELPEVQDSDDGGGLETASSENKGDHRGHGLPLPSLESLHPSNGGGPSSSTEPSRDGAEARTVAGSFQRERQLHSLSCTSLSGVSGRSDPMAAADIGPQRQVGIRDEKFVPLIHLAAPVGQDAGARHSALQAGTGAAAADTDQTQDIDPLHQLRLHRLRLLRDTEFENLGDWCYANASAVGLLWATLQRSTFCLEDLGAQIHPLGKLFKDMESSSRIALAAHSSLTTLFGAS